MSLDRIVVLPFDKTWVQKFEEEESLLKSVFTGIDITFFHIGSTSIPDCSAKPVIDILGVTPDILKIDAFNEEMIALGFKPLGEYGMKQRRFFQKKTGTAVNFHLFEKTDPEAKRHLRFCSYLRAHPDKVKEYSELKIQLSKQFPHDMESYILGKAKWIKEIDILAALAASPRSPEEKESKKRERWTLGEILKAMQVNMHLQMTYFAKYVPAIELLLEPDVTIIRSEIVSDTFNYVLSANFTEENAQEKIAYVTRLFKEPPRPFSWWVGESDTPSDLSEQLLKQGFSFKEKNIGMYMELEQLKESPATQLILQRAESLEQLKDFAAILVAIGGDSQAFDLIYSQAPPITYCGSSPFEMHVGYLDGAPVVTGILVTHANVAGIYYVATIPEERNRGFGTAMMKHLLTRAKAKGYFIATLQASSEGLSLYQRLGFKQCCQFSEYVPLKD